MGVPPSALPKCGSTAAVGLCASTPHSLRSLAGFPLRSLTQDQDLSLILPIPTASYNVGSTALFSPVERSSMMTMS